jgi:hypothetical protein
MALEAFLIPVSAGTEFGSWLSKPGNLGMVCTRSSGSSSTFRSGSGYRLLALQGRGFYCTEIRRVTPCDLSSQLSPDVIERPEALSAAAHPIIAI